MLRPTPHPPFSSLSQACASAPLTAATSQASADRASGRLRRSKQGQGEDQVAYCLRPRCAWCRGSPAPIAGRARRRATRRAAATTMAVSFWRNFGGIVSVFVFQRSRAPLSLPTCSSRFGIPSDPATGRAGRWCGHPAWSWSWCAAGMCRQVPHSLFGSFFGGAFRQELASTFVPSRLAIPSTPGESCCLATSTSHFEIILASSILFLRPFSRSPTARCFPHSPPTPHPRPHPRHRPQPHVTFSPILPF